MSNPKTLTKWRPLGWRSGKDDPFAPEGGHTPENTEPQYKAFKAGKYYTPGGKLTKTGLAKKDSQTAADVSANRKALRDSWNTHPAVWELAEKLVARPFRVDPFWNAQTTCLKGLERKLTGHSPQRDGLLSLGVARRKLADAECRWTPKQRAEIEKLIAPLADRPDGFPALWRGELEQGSAPAACNGPHSITERWLALADAYGQEEITASFVPENGDGWFQELGRRASIVVHLGRVPCGAPPGIEASSPRGASALILNIPSALDLNTLPGATRHVLDGGSLKVPLWQRARKGWQYGYVQTYSEVKLVDGDLCEVVDI